MKKLSILTTIFIFFLGIISSTLAQTEVKGSGNTSATKALITTNSDNDTSMVVLDDGNVGIGTTTPDYGFNHANATVLTLNAATTGGANDHPAVMEFRGSDANKGGVIGKMEFFNFALGQSYNLAKIEVTRSDASNQAYGSIDFFTRRGVASTFTSKMTINHYGNIGIGTTSPLVRLHVKNTGNAGFLGSEIGCLSFPANTIYPTIAGISSNNTSFISFGVYGQSISTGSASNIGVFGEAAAGTYASYGIYGQGLGSTDYSVAVYGYDAGTATNNFAGYFVGNVEVIGTLVKSAGTFKIDHPQDPANKYLIHSFVESPDMMNIYNGNIVTNEQGMAVVQLPGYFEAENIDFRYQLTVIGEFAQAIVKEEITGNQFVIMTNEPNIKVSWQVTGIRNDAYAQQNRIVPEVDKQGVEKGKYLHPELFGKSKSEGIFVGISENK